MKDLVEYNYNNYVAIEIQLVVIRILTLDMIVKQE